MTVPARDKRIDFIKQRLLRKGLPRLQVSLILLLTGLAGFLTSFSLLHLGVSRMGLRYPIAIVVAYCVFLLLLRLWLVLQTRRLEFDPEIPDLTPSGAPTPGGSAGLGGDRGDFGGGGAGGSWGPSKASTTSTRSSFIDGLSFDLDLDEGWLIVLALVALVGGLIASLYIVYIAPALLAEILVDWALLAGLYKRVQKIEQRYWLRAAIRRTLLPAILVAVFFTVAGFAMQAAVPTAHSIGGFWHHLMKR